jgi:hypothetical protein
MPIQNGHCGHARPDWIVDALFVRAADDPVVADRLLHTMAPEPLDNLAGYRRIVANISAVGSPGTQVAAALAARPAQDRGDDLRRAPIVRSVRGDDPKRIFRRPGRADHRGYDAGAASASQEADVILSNADVVQPDLVVVVEGPQISARGIDGAPLVLVEILSLSKPQCDRVTKARRYAERGVLAYWIVDPQATPI